MGAFLLIRRPKGVDVEEVESSYGDPIGVFDKKGLPLNKRLVTEEFVIYVFHKRKFQVDNVIRFDNDQFIISTGTLIYNRKIGRDALEELYSDFSEKGEFLSKVSGEYCIIVSKEGKLYLLNDYTGLYHVYSNDSRSVISSSFLAVAKTLKERKLSIQEFCEYVINGWFCGDKTPIEGINLINSRYIWQLSPVLSTIPKALNIRRLDECSSFDAMIQEVSSNLIDYFNTLKMNFGNNICSAVTGGFNTRLLLSLMRKVGIKPCYLYLYVFSPNDRTNAKIAELIANGENLVIEQEHMFKFSKFEEDEYKELLEKQYYMLDGLGFESGLFNNGSDSYTRLKRTDKAKLQLNGGGGGIYRDWAVLPDKSFHIKPFLKSKYDFVDYSIFSDCFDKSSYFTTFLNKIKLILNTDEERIDRYQIQMLYCFLFLKYWQGGNNSINNQLAYALTPFTDTGVIFQSFDIPLKFKQSGDCEAALVKFIDPDLAKYPTTRGYNFYDGISPTAKMKYLLKVHTPIWLRPYIRKRKWKQNNIGTDKFPYYFGKGYLDRIFPSSELNVSKYVHIDKINDPNMLSRVLSIELVLTNRF